MRKATCAASKLLAALWIQGDVCRSFTTHASSWSTPNWDNAIRAIFDLYCHAWRTKDEYATLSLWSSERAQLR